MIFRKTPKNKDKYIVITNMNFAKELQYNGFLPKYMDSEALYFVRSKEIESFIKTKEIENV